MTGRCFIPGCAYHLPGLPLSAETKHLQRHFRRAHRKWLTIDQAVTLRDDMAAGRREGFFAELMGPRERSGPDAAP